MIPIAVLIEAFRATLSLAENAGGKFDDGKYTENIIKLYGAVPTYAELDAQVEVIKVAADISTQEKLALLRAISAQKEAAQEREITLKKQCAEIINNGAARRGEVVGKVVTTILGVIFTAGISLIPLAIDYFGKNDSEIDYGDDEDASDDENSTDGEDVA